MGPKWQSGLNSALFALHVGERWRDTFFSLPHRGADIPLVALTPSPDLFDHAKDLLLWAIVG
jgi:hypothetical protein